MEKFSSIIDKNGDFAIDETILCKDAVTTAGSKILDDFKSLFSAEAVSRLVKCGYSVAGITPVGEFGLDLVGEFSYGHEQKGKLCGSASELVKNGDVSFALGVDMNGAPRRAAAISGVDFLKPTYGTVSRYGIISCAASGEQIGVYSKTTKTIEKTMKVIAGHDEKDGTSLPKYSYDYCSTKDVKGKKIAVFGNLLAKTDENVKKQIKQTIEILKKNGVDVEMIDFGFAELANVSWQILMSAETCNNISRYDGVKFGYRAEKVGNIDELYVKSRTECFNFLTKSIILYGSEALSKKCYKDSYEKSLRVRRLICDEMNKILKTYDAVLMPTCSTIEFASYDIKDAFLKVFDEMIFTSIPNITALPALTHKSSQFVGKAFDESTLLSLVSVIEQEEK